MHGDLCDCGWQKPIMRPMPTPVLSEPTNTLGQVERHASELGIKDNPAKAREMFFKLGKLAKLVPTEDDEEAKREREAIQWESAADKTEQT
mgnify:CR=1 FL=1